MRKPKIIVSKCLDFEPCRYDGQSYKNKVVQSLKEHAELKMVCPETEIGMQTPRDPIRIVIEKSSGNYKLLQHNTNNDYTEKMKGFSKDFLGNLEDIDGFILKSKSPSCGLKDVKIYNEGNKCAIRTNGNGVFSDEVLNQYIHMPIETDGRLTNYSNRENFFTKIFLINALKDSSNLKGFNKENELLLQSYNKEKAQELSLLLKNDINEDITKKYIEGFYETINTKRERNSKLKIIESVFGKYKNNLSDNEIKMFNETIESFNENKIPFSSLGLLIKMFATRFEDEETLQQSFFNPYPESLISISDSGKAL